MVGSSPSGSSRWRDLNFTLDELGINDAKQFRNSIPKMKFKRCRRIVDKLYPLYVLLKLNNNDTEFPEALLRQLGALIEPVMTRLNYLEGRNRNG